MNSLINLIDPIVNTFCASNFTMKVRPLKDTITIKRKSTAATKSPAESCFLTLQVLPPALVAKLRNIVLNKLLSSCRIPLGIVGVDEEINREFISYFESTRRVFETLVEPLVTSWSWVQFKDHKIGRIIAYSDHPFIYNLLIQKTFKNLAIYVPLEKDHSY